MDILKKKTLKGFTLIECIIALFILGISSLLLVQAYGQLMRVSSMSNEENISLSKQMEDAEKKNNGDADKVSTAQKDFKATKIKIGTNAETALNTHGADDYTFKVDSYQVKGKTMNNTYAIDGSYADSMRYVYFE